MKNVAEQLSTYKSVHLNKNNIKTHFIGIPLIIWSVALLFTSLSYDVAIGEQVYAITLTAVIAVIILLYYFILSIPLALMALPLFGSLIYSAIAMANIEHKWQVAVGVFVIGWIIQFIGHAYEKAKPAFVDDLNQLQIGPLFLIAEIYFAIGLGKNLNSEITTMAIEKRRAFEKAKQVP